MDTIEDKQLIRGLCFMTVVIFPLSAGIPLFKQLHVLKGWLVEGYLFVMVGIVLATSSYLVFGQMRGDIEYSENISRACFINRFGLKLGSLREDIVLMNLMHEQEAIRVIERCTVGTDRTAAA